MSDDDQRSRQFRSNLAALSKHQPDWVDRLERTPDPESAVPAVGRDATPTYRWSEPVDGSRWLARTSMPTVSATALAEDFTDTGGNVVLPGVYSGMEALLIERRMPAHGAVFIWVSRVVDLKLVLHLHDFAPAFRSGRIVLIDAGNAVAHARAFFQAHPGYEFPTRMIRVPQLDAKTLTLCQRQVEAAGAAVAQIHETVVSDILTAIRGHPSGSMPAVPRVEPPISRGGSMAVRPPSTTGHPRGLKPAARCTKTDVAMAVVTVDAREETLASMRRIERALGALGYPHAVCAPDAPRRCHVAARLTTVRDIRADLVLCVNCAPGHLEALLPRDLPLASWYLPETARGGGFAGVGDARFIACVSTVELAHAACEAGIPDARIEVIEVGADPEAIQARQAMPESPLKRFDVGVVVALADDRPEAARVTLSSHLLLYEELRRVCHARIEEPSTDAAPRWLELAQRRSGVRLRDAPLRDLFLGLIRTRLAPAALTRAIVSGLIARSRSVSVWGPTGGVLDDLDGWVRRPWPLGNTDLFHDCRAVIVPVRTAMTNQLLVDGLAAGVPLVCGRFDHRGDDDQPRLAAVLKGVCGFRSPSRAIRAVDEALSNRPGDIKERDRLAGIVAREHALTARIESILSAVRGRRASPR